MKLDEDGNCKCDYKNCSGTFRMVDTVSDDEVICECDTCGFDCSYCE